MARKVPHVTVSAVVSPAIAEELDRLAKANKVTRSTMVRQLLEERLTERAGERAESAFDRVEKRLAAMDNRFAALLVKSIKAGAASLYLQQVGLKYGHQRQEDKYMNKHIQDSQAYAAKWLESGKKQEKQAE